MHWILQSSNFGKLMLIALLIDFSWLIMSFYILIIISIFISPTYNSFLNWVLLPFIIQTHLSFVFARRLLCIFSLIKFMNYLGSVHLQQLASLLPLGFVPLIRPSYQVFSLRFLIRSWKNIESNHFSVSGFGQLRNLNCSKQSHQNPRNPQEKIP